MSMNGEEEEEPNVNRQLSVYKHIKKKAANDAQLLMNRIALIQKEEERARKKIEQTKERAVEILALRNDTQKRVKAYKTASGEVKQLQQIMLAKNREQEEESKRARQFRLESLQAKKKGGVIDMLMEKKYLTQMMIHEQEKEIQMKQKRRMEIKRMEEEARVRKEQERIEKEQKVKEYYAQKLAEEAAEAKRAEKLVRELEKKEREWIAKLREAQVVQEEAFDQLETALHKDGSTAGGTPPPLSSRPSRGSPGRFKATPSNTGSGEKVMGSPGLGNSGGLAEEDDNVSQAMSEMNMDDPVDAVGGGAGSAERSSSLARERASKERSAKEGAAKMRASLGGAGGSVGSAGGGSG
eukprot:CAMPEP_0170386500 /NCGR_PEP_ID=MMETSP0117_2-20130122/17064_1 /TAXON_ID=400756 /ORGANISM="Durinskia baltica, Strain CSIRO CS-38" /LENGTH=352 /DNA_ID=CAMNT_0010642319 /DNA_START=43 /DNA_END=1098 /DNA_ORIENTATION=-